jgi:hypothetical protein
MANGRWHPMARRAAGGLEARRAPGAPASGTRERTSPTPPRQCRRARSAVYVYRTQGHTKKGALYLARSWTWCCVVVHVLRATCWGGCAPPARSSLLGPAQAADPQVRGGGWVWDGVVWQF